jgi:hypothetical protein
MLDTLAYGESDGISSTIEAGGVCYQGTAFRLKLEDGVLALMKILALLLGVAAIGLVVWLGILTTNSQSKQLVAVFGIASAIIAPLGLALVGHAFRRNDGKVIERLAKVPEIEKLIIEASSQEERIRLLEKQKQQLTSIVLSEAKRQSLVTQKEALERDAVRVLNELQAIDLELSSITDAEGDNKDIVQEIQMLRERLAARQRGDLILTFGRKDYSFEVFVQAVPGLTLIYALWGQLQHIIDSRKPRDRNGQDTQQGPEC